MKRHLDYYTQPDQSLKDRSRFWTWYMRGLHGDMDTRYEGDGRLSRPSSRPVTVLVPEVGTSSLKPSSSDGFRFRPMASNTYGYHPKGGLYSRPRTPSVPVPEPSILDKPLKDWSTPLKPLDDLMLRGPSRSSSLPRSGLPRRPLLPSNYWRHLPLDPELDDLLKRPLWPRRGLANRLWRPNLFFDDDAFLPPGSWIRDPWWWKFPELRPLDLATPWNRPVSALRNSYLSPIKRTYLWGYHPLRPYGFHSWDKF